MAELIPTNKFVTVLGPIKMEIINLAGTIAKADGTGNVTGVDDGDTTRTTLHRALFAMASITSDDVTVTRSVNVTITEATKLLTINCVDLSDDNVAILVFGF
jgi:hypothetical protein